MSCDLEADNSKDNSGSKIKRIIVVVSVVLVAVLAVGAVVFIKRTKDDK